jgi:hypothetical protein
MIDVYNGECKLDEDMSRRCLNTMNIQMIDEFRRRTNASYDEAKYYLDKYNGDLLEAIIAYERAHTRNQAYSSENTRQHYSNKEYRNYDQSRYQAYRASQNHYGFGRGLMRVLQKLIDTKVVISDKDHRTFNIPVLIPMLLVPAWHIIFTAAVIMYFMGYRFSIQNIPDENMNVESFVGKVKDKVRDNTRSF